MHLLQGLLLHLKSVSVLYILIIIIKQGLSKQLFNLKFDLQQRYSGYDIDNRAASSTENEFVSAVCWKKSFNQPSNTIIAGNSRGIIKILELV
jgi:hypothetical protein